MGMSVSGLGMLPGKTGRASLLEVWVRTHKLLLKGPVHSLFLHIHVLNLL